MAIDPISGIINGIGLIMQQDAAGRAADAAANNSIFQRTVGLDNLKRQDDATGSMLGVSDELIKLLQSSGVDTGKLIDEITSQQSAAADSSGNALNKAAGDAGDARTQLANALAGRDLAQAKGSVDALNKAATANRGDVYGNITYYDPKTGGFNTSLSAPQTDLERKFTSAEDSRLSGLNEALARARFDRSPSESSIRGELEGLMGATTASKMKAIQDAVGAQAIRMGRGGDIATLIKSIDDNIGSKLPQTMLDARNQAVNEYIARENARRSGASADLNMFATPYTAPTSLTNADADRRSATDNLSKTLTTDASLGQNAVTTAGNRISSAQDAAINSILATLGDTSKTRLSTLTANNALKLNNQSNDIQKMIDALTQRENIYNTGATRTQNAYATGMGATNTANATNVTAIGKEAPNATILNNLADNFSITPDSSSSKSSSKSNQQIIDSIMSSMGTPV